MEKVESLWDRMKKQVIEGYSTAVEKADELARIGHRKLDAASIRRHIGREMMTLGGRVFHLIDAGQQDDVVEDDEVLRSMERIRNLKSDLERKEEEIEAIRRKVPEGSGVDDGAEATIDPAIDRKDLQ